MILDLASLDSIRSKIIAGYETGRSGQALARASLGGGSQGTRVSVMVDAYRGHEAPAWLDGPSPQAARQPAAGWLRPSTIQLIRSQIAWVAE
jgi:hypothetical protein